MNEIAEALGNAEDQDHAYPVLSAVLKPGSARKSGHDVIDATDSDPEAGTEPEASTSVAIGALFEMFFFTVIAAIGGLVA